MIAMPKATGSHALIQYLKSRELLDMIVGCFAGDNHVVHVTLTQACAGDAHEARLLLKLRDGTAAEIAHAGAQAADELKDHGLKRAAIGNAALDAFRDKFGEAVFIGALALHHVGGLALRAAEIR